MSNREPWGKDSEKSIPRPPSKFISFDYSTLVLLPI